MQDTILETAEPRWIKRAVVLALYVFCICVLLAEVEIQIEGPAGWAANLPTWRTTNPSITWIFGGKPVTGYHVFMNLLLIAFYHFPLLFCRPTLRREAQILWTWAIVAVVWDFLWFALNPSYGMSHYSAKHIWWFKTWALGVPVDYFIGIGMSLVFWMLPALKHRDEARRLLFRWLTSTGIVVGLAALVAGIRFALVGS